MNRHLIQDQDYREGYPFFRGLTKSISTFIINSIIYLEDIYAAVSSYTFLQRYYWLFTLDASGIPFNLVYFYRKIAPFKFSYTWHYSSFLTFLTLYSTYPMQLEKKILLVPVRTSRHFKIISKNLNDAFLSVS